MHVTLHGRKVCKINSKAVGEVVRKLMVSEACFCYCFKSADEMEEWPSNAVCPKHPLFIAAHAPTKQAFP